MWWDLTTTLLQIFFYWVYDERVLKLDNHLVSFEQERLIMSRTAVRLGTLPLTDEKQRDLTYMTGVQHALWHIVARYDRMHHWLRLRCRQTSNRHSVILTRQLTVIDWLERLLCAMAFCFGVFRFVRASSSSYEFFGVASVNLSSSANHTIIFYSPTSGRATKLNTQSEKKKVT